MKYLFKITTFTLLSSILNMTNAQNFVINKEYKSDNFNSRIRQIIIHYTVTDTERSFEELLGKDVHRAVSSHYLINNAISKKYPDIIYQLVPESKRSWHAGVSAWGSDSDLNNSSIGIEIVNKDGNLYPFTQQQIEALIFLVKQIKQRYAIKDINIIGHSDIAPSRKIDPGTLFPWKKLAKNGLSAWYDKSDIEYFTHRLKSVPDKEIVKQSLIKYGYSFSAAPNDPELYRSIISAFQRHFRPNKVNGVMDLESYIILSALIKKYR
ncbi:MAG: N-acetylmuramoyl-L-alanine amidase [Gammaproteobacteria bacterium]|nr:MAG: N-acetylmuramoyl-L-alanine amidase [Gammaproteobacteria bacterium]